MPLNNLAKEREQLLSDKAVLKYNYDKLEKENALLIEALKNISNGLAHAINATSTGTIRNLLTDVNIIALNAIK